MTDTQPLTRITVYIQAAGPFDVQAEDTLSDAIMRAVRTVNADTGAHLLCAVRTENADTSAHLLYLGMDVEDGE